MIPAPGTRDPLLRVENQRVLGSKADFIIMALVYRGGKMHGKGRTTDFLRPEIGTLTSPVDTL